MKNEEAEVVVEYLSDSIIISSRSSSNNNNIVVVVHSKCGRVKNRSKRVKVHSFKEPYE